jgi:hypothetical protein
VSGFGVAAGILGAAGGGGSSGSMMKLKITDLLFMQFDDKFDIKKATIYEKKQ